MSAQSYRRVVGILLGALLGLTYGLISQGLNRILLPGLPLYQPPFGVVGNCLLMAACGAIIGLLTAWTEESISSIIIASGVSALALVVGSFLQSKVRPNLAGMAAMSLFLSIYIAAMLALVIAALRWGVNRLADGRRDHDPWPRRLLGPLLLLLAVGGIGAASLYPAQGRTILRQVDVLLRAGQMAQTKEALPAPLRVPGDGAFLQRGQDRYELSWEKSRVERYRIPRPVENFNNHTVAVVRFKNGWNLVCLYVTLDRDPICVGMDNLPK